MWIIVLLLLGQFGGKPGAVVPMQENGEPIKVQPVKELEDEKPLPPEPTPEQLMESLWQIKSKPLIEQYQKLLQFSKENDYSKLSPEAIAKLEKPTLEAIKKIEADKEIPWNIKYPFFAARGEVFRFPRSNPRLAINDEFQVLAVIDATTVAVQMEPKLFKQRLPVWAKAGDFTPKTKQDKLYGDYAENPANRSSPIIVIQGIKEGEFLERKGAPIRLTGLWRRVDAIKLDGSLRIVIERYPYEDEVKQKWAAFLKAKEKAAKTEVKKP